MLVGVAAFMLVSPLHRVLGGRSPYLRDWVLYRDVGVGLVEAQFSRRVGEEEEEVDRYTALGVRRGTAPRSLTHIDGEAGLYAVCRQLCAALGAGTDLRVRARIATTGGWATIDEGTLDRCGPQPPRPVRRDVRPRRLHD